MIIPYKKLSPEALQGIISQFVSRDGPDSGHVEIPLDVKISQVKRQLETGRCVIVYDKVEQTCNIISKDDPDLKSFNSSR